MAEEQVDLCPPKMAERNTQLPSPYLQQVLEEHLGHFHYIQTRIAHLDAQILDCWIKAIMRYYVQAKTIMTKKSCKLQEAFLW